MLTDLNWQVAPTLHWSEAFGLWLKRTPTRKARERGVLTLDAYMSDVRLFGEWFEAVNGCAFSLDQLNSTNLKAYFRLLEAEAKPATYNRKLASIRMLIGFARQEGVLDIDPAEWIPFIDAMRESPRDVSDEERLKLEGVAEVGTHLKRGDALQLRDLLMFRLLLNAGLRTHEVVGLRMDDLHLQEGYIHVLGKGKKHRKVRVGGRLVEVINTWLAVKPGSLEETLVTDLGGRALGRTEVWRRFTMIACSAGVKTTPHAMRHTYVYRFMNAYMAGDPWKLPAAIDAVCQQTGDKPEVILAYYTRARESDMRAAAEVV